MDNWLYVHPPTWSRHPQGANFLALITPDRNAPSNVQRLFQPINPSGEGASFQHMAPGDAFELGSLDVDRNGKMIRPKLYGVITRLDRSSLEMILATSAGSAFDIARSVQVHLPKIGPIQTLQRKLRDAHKLLATLVNETSELEEQIRILQVQEQEVLQERADSMGVVAVPAATQVVPYSILKDAQPLSPESELLDQLKALEPEMREELTHMLLRMVESVKRREPTPTDEMEV